MQTESRTLYTVNSKDVVVVVAVMNAEELKKADSVSFFLGGGAVGVVCSLDIHSPSAVDGLSSRGGLYTARAVAVVFHHHCCCCCSCRRIGGSRSSAALLG